METFQPKGSRKNARMKVKELIAMLKTLDPEAVVNMASDGEGNSYGNIDDTVAEGKFKDGTRVYSLYPGFQEGPEGLFQEEE